MKINAVIRIPKCVPCWQLVAKLIFLSLPLLLCGCMARLLVFQGAAAGGGALAAAEASVLVGTRLGAAALSRAVPLRAGGGIVPIEGTVEGRLMLRASIQREGTRVLLRDQFGNSIYETRVDASGLVSRRPNGTIVGRSEIKLGGKRLEHYQISEGRDIYAGYDEVVSPSRIAHYNAQGKLIGSTMIRTKSTTTNVIELAFVAAATASQEIPTPQSEPNSANPNSWVCDIFRSTPIYVPPDCEQMVPAFRTR